ncbi:hypothetical protein Trydic_g16432 [Trypoxylus dichotomus]
MSVVLITQHDESIYNVTKKPEGYQMAKEILYHSQHEERFRNEKTNPKLHKEKGTLGPARLDRPKPNYYLKKNTGKPPMLPAELMDPDYGHHKCMKESKWPPIPLRKEVLKEQDEKLIHPPKDFITKNVKAAIAMKPKEPERKIAVDRTGTKKELKAGLQPEYIYSKEFAKIPQYLDKFIKVKERQEQIRKDLALKVQPKCRYITREQRDLLLSGLKQNWEELQTQYQGLPILTDTIPKINRKSKLEADLKQLEKDIVLVERHPYIYVYDDDEL